jgi:hypothetical protein
MITFKIKINLKKDNNYSKTMIKISMNNLEIGNLKHSFSNQISRKSKLEILEKLWSICKINN